MNVLDLSIVGTILLFTLLGAYWGVIRQILALLGLVAATVLAGRYGTTIGFMFRSFIVDATLSQAVGHLFVFITVSTLVSLLASLLRRYVGLLLFSQGDVVFGGLLGCVQGLFSWSFLLIIGAVFPGSIWWNWIEQSNLAGPLVTLCRPLLIFLPLSFDRLVRLAYGL